MKRVLFLSAALMVLVQAPAHAFITDDAIAAMMYAEECAYHAFMKIQVIEEIATIKQNYDASVRYYDQFKQLNSGRGLFSNIATEIKTAQNQQDLEFQQQINSTFIHTYNVNTGVDKLYQTMDKTVVSNIQYAGKEMANVISNQQTGQQIATNANGLAPKDAANLAAHAQGLELQMLTQIHQDNLRIIQLESMELAAQSRSQQEQAQAIDSMTQDIQTRYPNAVPPTATGGNQ